MRINPQSPAAVILASLATLAILGLFLDWRQALAYLGQTKWEYLLLLIASLQVQQLAGGNRFRLCLEKPHLSTTGAWATENLAGLSAYFLPFGAGEAGRLLIWRRQARATLTEIAAVYLFTRFFDVFIVLTMVTALVWLIPDDESRWTRSFRLGFTAAWLAQATLYGLFMLFGSAIVAWAQNLLTRQPWARRRPLSWLAGQINALAAAGQRLSVLSGGPLARLLGWSALYWGLQFLDIFWIIGSMGFALSFFQVLTLYLVWWGTVLVPIQGVARLGSHEAGWTGALLLMGFSGDQSLAVAAASHAILLTRLLLAQVFTLALIICLARKGQWA